MQRHRQRGNALFMILIAIFLLGALTALMARSGSENADTGDTEKVSIEVSKLVRFTSSVQAAVQRMLMNGVSESDINFNNKIYTECDGTTLLQPLSHNPNCTEDDCQIFNVNGGGITPVPTPPTLIEDMTCTNGSWALGAIGLDTVRVEGIGTGASDLAIEVYALTRDACKEINRLSGVENPSGEPPIDDEDGGAEFGGDYGVPTMTIGDDAPELVGKKAFCLHRAPGSTYHFYTVLIAR